jgi:MSHA biogenesis protein MshP
MNHSNCSRRNPEPGTRNSELGTQIPEPGHRQRGLSIVTAIFLLVVLALLGAFMLSVTGLQQSSLQLDVQGVRAYQAARAGIEWGAWQVLDPNHTLNPVTCSPVVLPGCPASPTNLSGLAGSLSPFTVTVTCSATVNAPTTEGNRNVGAYQIIATACNQPSAGACPNASPAGGYVERQLQATLSKCKDPTATAPRCACG